MQVMPSSASSRIVTSTPFTVSGSSAAVTSSNSITSGFIASERAIAMRCCWPPESSPGYDSSLPVRRTLAISASAWRSTSFLSRLSTCTGAIMTFSSAVLCGNRLYCWNTMPTLRRSASLSSFGSLTSCPSTRIEPRSIGTSALTQRKSVDFPEPDGPMMQITSPFMTSIVIPLSTSTPPPKVLCTSARRTSGWSGVQGISATLSAQARASGHPGPQAQKELGPRFRGDERSMCCRSSSNLKPLFQRERRARDGIAIEEKPQQQIEIHRNQQFGARFR